MINKEKDKKKNNNKKSNIVDVAKGQAYGRLVIRDKETGQILRNEKG